MQSPANGRSLAPCGRFGQRNDAHKGLGYFPILTYNFNHMEPTSRFMLAGQTARIYYSPITAGPLDVPGGNVVYAAVGLAIWEPDHPPAIVARVGEDYPQEWIGLCARRGLDTRGVRVLPQTIDLRSFSAYTSRSTRSLDDPVAHFARVGLPFPKALLGYRNTSSALNSRTHLSAVSLRQGDILLISWMPARRTCARWIT